ncbi:MAG: RIP metalloprotease RseP [Deltaproteobacteria bacterium]|nr:RIP metalloprotease RseP [Deltaproteobacteria bacterium]
MITTIIATIIVLGVLIFVHELGHFLMAKKSKVGVITFSLGFGPKLLGKKIGETQYQISLVPLGGYVKMVGEEPGEKVPPELAAKSFSTQPVSKRLGIVFAGPFFNFLFAIVAFAIVFMVGMPALLPEVGEVKPDYPAFKAGILKGDRILEANGSPLKRWEDLAQVIHESSDRPLLLKVERDKKIFQLSVTPQVSTQKNIFGDEVQVGLIGISPSGSFFTERFDPFTATYKALIQSWRITELTVVSIVKIIEGKIPAKTIGGPILIAQLAGQQAKAGTLNLIIFMAVISINLVILNVLPIPPLDGWHLLIFLIEGIIGKPVNLKLRERAQQVGIFLIILLMLLVFYNDLSRIIGTQ